jgi:hypothetical protein
MIYTIKPGIACYVHVTSEALPEYYGEHSAAFIFNKPGDIQPSLNSGVQLSDIPAAVRRAVTKHFDTVFALSIDERCAYMKTVEPIVVDVPVWSVVEQCGYAGERKVSTWDTYDDAYCAVKEQYTPEEEDELHVSILRDGSSEY